MTVRDTEVTIWTGLIVDPFGSVTVAGADPRPPPKPTRLDCIPSGRVAEPFKLTRAPATGRPVSAVMTMPEIDALPTGICRTFGGAPRAMAGKSRAWDGGGGG